MNQNFIPANKVLYEMRRAAMADFMRWWKKDAKRKWIADDTFWDEINEIARKCKGEGETEDQGNRHLGMPRIGSGLDQLNWNRVLEMINEIFYYNDVVITIKDGK